MSGTVDRGHPMGSPDEVHGTANRAAGEQNPNGNPKVEASRNGRLMDVRRPENL